MSFSQLYKSRSSEDDQVLERRVIEVNRKKNVELHVYGERG